MAESRTGSVTVCRLGADEWQAYRAIRLAMLQESPSAFASSHGDAASFDEQMWRQRLTDAAVFLARVDQRPAGSAMYSDIRSTDPGDCELYGMWVDPAFRGTGVGRALLDAVVVQARAEGKKRVVLHVVADNSGARSLYEREGFVVTGRGLPYPNDDEAGETRMPELVEMALVLRDVAGSVPSG